VTVGCRRPYSRGHSPLSPESRHAPPAPELKEFAALSLRWQAASWAASEPLQAVSGKPLVEEIARASGDEPKYPGQRKGKPQKIEHAQDGGGAQQNRVAIEQNNRAHAAHGQAGSPDQRRAGLGLTRRESKDIATIESQQEIDPAITKCAFAIEDYDWVAGKLHSLFSPGGGC